jgi:hypothetical protein
MPEELKPAQKTDEIVQPATPNEGNPDGEVGSGDADPTKQEPEGQKPDGKKPQSREENAEFARRRREEERQKALEQRELETAIKLTGGENPYTHEKIEDKTDLDELYLMREIEKNGGDPIADFAKYQKQKRKEMESRGQKQAMTEDQAREDWQKFSTAHPEIKIDDLMADEDFLAFAEGKIGNKPLAQIYEDYEKRFLSLKKPKKEEPPAPTVKKTPGPLGQPAPQNTEIYSKSEYENLVKNPEALRRLSNAEFEKVRKSKDYWAKH